MNQGQNPNFRQQSNFRQQRDGQQQQRGPGGPNDMGRRPPQQNRGPHMGGNPMHNQGGRPQPHMGGGGYNNNNNN